MPSHELTITLAPPGRLGVETLTKTLGNALAMLRTLEREFVEFGTEVRWEVVKLQMRSPLRLTVSPSIDGKPAKAVGGRIVKAALVGVKNIEKSATHPKHFDEDTLEATRDLFRVVRKDGSVLKLSLDHKNEVTVTDRAFEHIEDVVLRARVYVDHGTIEGQLDEISVHESPVAFIWERFPVRRIKCVIAQEQVEQVKELLGRRVALTGRISYRNHKPVLVQVEAIRAMRDDSELPDIRDIQPIDITGGLSPEEYVRRLRDD
jgi:hypothetical protein